MLRSTETSTIKKFVLVIGISLASTQATSQTTVENSILITGERAQVNISEIPKGELQRIHRLSIALTDTLKSANSFKAENALKNGNYALAAEIWSDIAKEELLVNKSKTKWASATLRKAEAEEHYDIATASKTINEALLKNPDSPILLEKSAILSLSLHQLPQAKGRLLSLSHLLERQKTVPALTKYLLHFRLWVGRIQI